MKVWVTRDSVCMGSPDGDICVWDKDTISLKEGTYDAHGIDMTVKLMYQNDPKPFKKLFGFTPRKGTCKQYELSLKEIK